jgi:hypothetical protein
MHLHCETSALDPPSEQSTLEPDVIDLQTVCTLGLMFAGRASPNHCTEKKRQLCRTDAGQNIRTSPEVLRFEAWSSTRLAWGIGGWRSVTHQVSEAEEGRVLVRKLYTSGTQSMPAACSPLPSIYNVISENLGARTSVAVR